MNKPIIMLDMDDVLADFCSGWVSQYNEDHNDNLQPRDVTSWQITQFMKEEARKDVAHYLCHKFLYSKLQVKEHAQEVVQRWIEKGYEVFIVTDSPMSSSSDEYFHSNPADEKRAWLQQHFPFVPLTNFIVSGKKWMIAGDVLVDDKPETIEKFQELGRKIIAFDMPYNREVDAIYRCSDWLHLEQVMEYVLHGYDARTISYQSLLMQKRLFTQ